jgi:hypothetical protein
MVIVPAWHLALEAETKWSVRTQVGIRPPLRIDRQIHLWPDVFSLRLYDTAKRRKKTPDECVPFRRMTIQRVCVKLSQAA